jgi:hypothetical protein
MFPNASSAAPSSPAWNPATQGVQGDAYPGASPAVFRVSNVDASADARPVLPYWPVIPIGQLGESIDAQVLGNLRLRAAFAYGQVMCLIWYQRRFQEIGRCDDVLLERIACGLKNAIRTGSIPSSDTFEDLYDARGKCDKEGMSYKSLHLATAVLADNENSSLHRLPPERLHLAHAVELAVMTEDESSDRLYGSSGCTEVIRGLAACVTLGQAKHYLDQPMNLMSPAEVFRQRLGLARAYLQQCLSNPEFSPNRFTVEDPLKEAIDEALRQFDEIPTYQELNA